MPRNKFVLLAVTAAPHKCSAATVAPCLAQDTQESLKGKFHGVEDVRVDEGAVLLSHVTTYMSQRVAFCSHTAFKRVSTVWSVVTGSLNKHGLCDTESHRQSQKWYGSSVI